MLHRLEEFLSENSSVCAMKISFTTAHQDNESLLPFLNTLGFLPEEGRGRNIYCFTLEELRESLPFVPRPAVPLRSNHFHSYPKISCGQHKNGQAQWMHLFLNKRFLVPIWNQN